MTRTVRVATLVLVLTVHAKDERTLSICPTQLRRHGLWADHSRRDWTLSSQKQWRSSRTPRRCLWQGTICEIRFTSIDHFCLMIKIVVQVDVLVVQLTGQRARVLVIVEVHLVVVVIIVVVLELELHVSSCRQSNRLLLIDQLLSVRVAHVLPIRSGDGVKVVEPIVDVVIIVVDILLIVTAAGDGRRLGELSHKAVRLEVTLESSRIIIIIIGNVLVISIVIVLLLLVIVGQVAIIHGSRATVQQRSLGLIKRMISG